MAGESAKAERPGALMSSADPAPESAAAQPGPASAPRPPAPAGPAAAAAAAAGTAPPAGAAAGLTAALGRFGARPAVDGKGAADSAHRPGKPTMALAAIAGLMLVAAPFGFSETGMRLAGAAGAAGTEGGPADAAGAPAGAQVPAAGGGPVVPGDGGAGGGQDPGGFVPDVLPQAPGAVGEEDGEDGGGGGESGGGGGEGGSGPVGEAPAQSLVDGAPGEGEDGEGGEDREGGAGGGGEKDGEKDGEKGPGDRPGEGGEKDAEADPEKGAPKGEDGPGGEEGGKGGGAEAPERPEEKGPGKGEGGGDGGSGGGAPEKQDPQAAEEGGPFSTHLDSSPGSRDVKDDGNYVAVAGPGCDDRGASYALHGGGIERTGSSGYTDLGCDDSYDALPVSGDPNSYAETAATWTFTPGTTNATCALRILVVNDGHPLWESGEPAHYELFNGDRAGGENRGVYKIGRPEGGNYWAVTEFGDVNRSFTLRLTNTGSAGKLPASVVEAECW
ncbi:hypothetical protein J0910_05005 [Nocardiopsis sp. CNT-189]|uniref:hypothetical protein n=1 Tax=Nocardiopsis oceanisediminis TaxID=2816862 RepID=UPI003B38A22E